jgi:hypothetical protein
VSSLKGVVEAQCPNGCKPFEAQVWSLVRLDHNPELREQLMAGELNLLSCRTCRRHFYFDHTVVVHDPRIELLAFVFPAYYKDEAKKWSEKMRQDYEILERRGGEAIDYPPVMFFGLEELRVQLEKEDDVQDEVEIARHLSKSLKLELYAVKPSVAREREIPSVLPCASNGGDMRSRLLAGLEQLLHENAYLRHYKDCLGQLQSAKDKAVPPPAKE